MTKLSRDEFDKKVTELAKKLIRDYCVKDNGEVEYVEYACYESTKYDIFKNITDEYPLSIEKYCQANFGPDAHDMLSQEMSECIKDIRTKLLTEYIDLKIQDLINGEWDAIKTETVEYKVEEDKTVLDE